MDNNNEANLPPDDNEKWLYDCMLELLIRRGGQDACLTKLEKASMVASNDGRYLINKLFDHSIDRMIKNSN